MNKFPLDFLRRPSLLVNFLDRTIPLRDASHCEVVAYGVDTPTRYSEFYAVLKDGRTVRLRDKQQFVAWQRGKRDEQRFLFRGPQGRIEVLNGRMDRHTTVFRPADTRKFITRDGGLLAVKRWGRVFAAPFATTATDPSPEATMPHASLPLESMA